MLVSFKETAVQADRTKEEAEALAGELLEKARGGADFDALVREHSDDPVQPDDPEPGVYRLLNNGVEGMDFGQMVSQLNEQAAEREQLLRKAIEDGEMAVADAEAQMQAFVEELRGKAAEAQREPVSTTPNATTSKAASRMS